MASRFLLLLVWLPAVVTAHMVSISTGDLTVEGNRARYELRMPLYETEVMDTPQKTLFEHFELMSGGERGKIDAVTCRELTAEDAYVCMASFEFPAAVDVLQVTCTFPAVTVPNHVHVLRASRGEVTAQEIFDLTATTAEINFIPPTFWEIAHQQVLAGAKRASGGLASLSFLFAMVIASRRRKELLALAGMFVTGQVAACILVPLAGWHPAPRFVESAAALTVAYLAVEVLLLPGAGQRWLVLGVLGLFHGLYLELFLRETMFSPFYVLPGALLTEAAIVALLALAWNRLKPIIEPIHPVRTAAVLLLLFGLSWFFLRLQG